jgi:4-carboxymuconolactone decarboxylase
MPEIPADKMTQEQKQTYAQIASGRRGAVYGPFIPLLRSPQLASHLQKTGEYLRYHNSMPPKLRELVILMTARQWTQQVEWYIHHPIALKEGLKPEIAQAVAEGRRPEGMSEDEELLYELCAELRQNQTLGDKTYDRAVARFGEQGIIDLLGLIGYYTWMAIVMNVARTSLSPGAQPPLTPCPR